MELITFDKTRKKKFPVIKNSIPFITFNERGKFNFSQGARRLLSISEESRVLIHQDATYRSDWYIEITSEERGYKIVCSKTDSRFTCKSASINIFKSIGKIPSKARFRIIEKPFLMTGKSLYRIDTKNDLK